jgi:tRNA threonylcarbamoyl adenosine modification protein (Sua5/YciO/YrdC/YwlC family)
MIEYVIAHNPDDRVLAKASDILKSGGLICFPTDTSWVLAACSTQKSAIEKLYKIKKEQKQKHFSLLCDEISTASEVAIIENNAFKILKKIIPGHYTFIFEATKKISKLLQASKTDKEVGIRFVPSVLVDKIIQSHGQILVSTNVPKSMLGLDEDSTEMVYSYQIEEAVSHLVGMIIDPGEFEFSGASTIIHFQEDIPELIREGAGDISKIF